LRPLPSRRAKRPIAIIAVLAIVSLLIVSLSGPTISGVARVDTMKVSAKGDAALAKLHPQLRQEMSNSPDSMVRVHVYVQAGTDLSAVVSNAVTRAYVDPRGYTGVTGNVKARELPKLASIPNVNTVVPMGGAFAPAVDSETVTGRSAVPSAEMQAKMRTAITSRDASYTVRRDPDAPSPTGWFDVMDVHHSSAAWDKGYTGAGVKAMVNDSGVDFSHPDLIGTEARVTDPASPYYGWPLQYDQYGMLQLATDAQAGTTNLADGNAGGYTDTSTVVTESDSSYQPVNAEDTHEYTLTGTSQSGDYHIGTHPDQSLTQWYALINGVDLSDPDAVVESPAVLVVDEGAAGVYDTVYVDLNFNYDFSDDKAARQGDEHVGADWWGEFDPATGDFDPEPDGFYDESGGMLYFIADGANPIPASDWYWELEAPANGSLVAFSMSSWWTSPAGDHGQLVASGIAAQGRTNADSFDSIFGATQLDRDTGGIVPPWKPDDASGMVTAAGKDVKIVDSGDFYSTGYVDAFVFAALGYDGEPGTDDDSQFINNSWGAPGIDAGYDSFSRLVDYYQRFLNPTLLSGLSSGNDGPGYGSASTPATQSGLNVGASSSYGSTGWDSASGVDQINYNDVVSFSSRGPGRLGDAFVDVVASGNRSSGAIPLNMAFSGPHAWITWGGTSRATPVAIGNAALMYQAYKEAHGVWPDQDTAKAILKSSAQDLRYDPFLQGTGSVDADRAVDVAAGNGGWYVTPDEWTAGDWDETHYQAFPNVMMPGETADMEFTVNNTSDSEMYLDVSDRWLEHSGQWQMEWTSSPVSEEELTLTEGEPGATDFTWDEPHYLWNVTDQIPEDADIVVFRQNFGFDQWNPDGGYDGSQVNDWYLMAYHWKDINGDGNLWEDLDGNGTVNTGEMDAGEYTRFDYSNQRDNAGFLSLRNPLDRTDDGFFIALMHNQARADVPTTDMLLTLDFYQQMDFDWLSTYSSQVYVDAHDSNIIRAKIQLPKSTPVGVYEAAIQVSDDNWTSTIPVTINVAGRDNNMTVGGGDVGEEIYQNDGVYGAVDWIGSESSGDWRVYFANLPENPGGIKRMPNGQQYWMVDTDWQDMPTDINAHILGPTADQFSDLVPGYFGPYALTEIGGSDEGYTGSGVYLIQTSSGDSREVVAAPYTPGLNEIVLHNVTYDGNSTMEDFSLRAGVIGVSPSPIDVSRNANQPNHSVNAQLVSTMQLSGLVADGYGLSKPDVQTGVAIQQDDPDDPSTASYKQEFTLEHAGLLEISTDGTDRDDLDLFVLYDFNGDGELTDDEVVGQSTTSTADESVTLTLPADGLYGIWVHGWAVSGGESTFDISVNAVQGTDVAVTDLPEGTIEAGRTYNFKVDVDATGKEPGVYTGVVTLGPPEGPSSVLVFINYEIKE
jgi:hypothetical protein